MISPFSNSLLLWLSAFSFLSACGGVPDAGCGANRHADESGVCVCDDGYDEVDGVCQSDDVCAIDLQAEPQKVDFSPTDPRDGDRSLQLQLLNPGTADALIDQAFVETEDNRCGTFSLLENLDGQVLEAGAQIAATLQFTPDPDTGSGCGCHSFGRLYLRLGGMRNCPTIAVPLVALGPCEQPLRCNPDDLSFPAAIQGYTSNLPVTCYHFGEQPVMVDSLGLSDDTPATFALEYLSAAPPVQLAFSQFLEFSVAYHPTAEGEERGSVWLKTATGDEQNLPLFGRATRERPLCENGIPEMPQPVLQGDGYRITLESEALSTHRGVVRSQWFYSEPPMMSDILVTSGDYADPACSVGQDGHYAWWRNCYIDEGTFINVHAIPYSEQVEFWVRSLEIWDEVSVIGYEVDRVLYDNGSWWQDAGCHTMIITYICDHGNGDTDGDIDGDEDGEADSESAMRRAPAKIPLQSGRVGF